MALLRPCLTPSLVRYSPGVTGGIDLRLDTGTMLDTDAQADFDVAANDPLSSTISAPSIISGPAGTVTIVSNSIRLVPSTDGIYVISYTATIGALSSTGILTVVVTPTAGGGTPPAVGVSFQDIEMAGGGVNPITIPLTGIPADTRVLLFSMSTVLAFGAIEPQTLATLNPSYAGEDLTRIDDFDDQIFRGDSNVGTSTGPGVYVFALQTPGDAIAAFGDLTYTTTFSAGNPEFRLASVIAITHPTADLTLTQLGASTRSTGSAGTAVQAATAPDNSVVVNYTSAKANPTAPTLTGDGAWTPQENIVGDGSSGAVSGRHLAETRVFTTGGNADHTTTFDLPALFGTATFAAHDVGGGGAGTLPTNAPQSLTVTPGGPAVPFDPRIGNGGTTPISTTAVNRISGSAEASLASDVLTITPPSADGESQFEITMANAAGASISILTVPASAFATGPQSGDAAGLGLSGETTTQIAAAIAAGVVNQRARITALNDDGLNEAQIRALHPDMSAADDLVGTSDADFRDALNLGRRKFFLRASTTYSFNTLGDNQDLPTDAGVKIVGLPGAVIDVGGTAKGVGNRKWRVRHDFHIERVRHINGAVPWSLIGADTTINQITVTMCQGDNIGALFHHELPTAPDPNLIVNNYEFSKNILTNVRDGMNMRLSVGGTNPAAKIINAIVEDNWVDRCSRYGLAIHYDNPPTGLNYGVANSNHIFRRNLVENVVTMDGNGFMISAGAAEDHLFEDNWVVNCSRGGSGFDAEALYAKCAGGAWRGNVIWNAGQCDFQGMVAGKGEPGLSGNVLSELLIEFNFFGSDQGDTDNLLWYQRSRQNAQKNTFIVGSDSRVFAGQSASPYQDGKFFDNRIRLLSTTGNSGAQIFGDWQDFQCGRNVWDYETASNSQVYRAVSDNAVAARTIDRFSIDADVFNKLPGSGTPTWIVVERRVSQIVDPSFTNSQFNGDGAKVALACIGNPTNTPITWTGNTQTGTVPTINNAVDNTIQTLGAGGGNGF